MRRTGTLINKPLKTVTALKRSGIEKLSDFKGKKVGYGVAGLEEALIATMLRHVGLSLSDVTLVNLNFAAGDGADVERGGCGDRHLPYL